ncbi:MAG: hypothetical protein JWL77_3595 [Chthonomonadaceae bacterium]|nr:hypothetical protein [Chthonomonadaceae bacterium]
MVIIPPDERHGETEKIYAVWLDEKQKASLEQLYNEFRQPQADEINKKVNELNLFGAEQSNEAHDKTAQGCSMEEPSTSST